MGFDSTGFEERGDVGVRFLGVGSRGVDSSSCLVTTIGPETSSGTSAVAKGSGFMGFETASA